MVSNEFLKLSRSEVCSSGRGLRWPAASVDLVRELLVEVVEGVLVGA